MMNVGLIDDAATLSWRLIQTGPACERRVADALRMHLPEARHGDIYIPMETVWRFGQRKRVPHSRPLIRGYVFAALADRELPLLHDVNRAARLVTLGGRAVTLSPIDVLDFRVAEQAGKFDATRPEKSRQRGEARKLGDEVRLVGGVFAGFVGKVTKLKGDRRVTVMLALLAGRPVTLPLTDVELVKPPAEPVIVAL